MQNFLKEFAIYSELQIQILKKKGNLTMNTYEQMTQRNMWTNIL